MRDTKYLIIFFLLIFILSFPKKIFSQDPPKCRLKSNTFLEIWRFSKSMIFLTNSSFIMGSSPKYAIRGDRETPQRRVQIHCQFWIDQTEITVNSFAKFIQATNYKTTAELYGNSYIFWMEDSAFDESMNISGKENLISKLKSRGSSAWWWIQKDGLTWRTGMKERLRHPVVHVSWKDALAYCKWKGGRLPTEVEWEFSCRGGLEDCLYPWGNKLKPIGKDGKKVHMTNIWQGKFPFLNTKKDQFISTSPGGTFPSNAYEISDMSGNVWEWVLDSFVDTQPDFKVQKGGSFLCHRDNCFRYRCSARTKGSKDSTASNLGFRCVA